MIVATRKADGRARLILPDDFANATIIIERIGENQLHLRKKVSLAQLVAGITSENVHTEVDAGAAVGSEAL